MKILTAISTVLLLIAISSAAYAETYYFHNDHLGTPQALTDKDQNVVWQAEYDPFGKATEAIATVEQNLRFPGQYLDRESGLHYNYFRSYDPGTGRYTQSDPIGLGGGINTYGYAYQNPISNYDPDGRLVWAVVNPWTIHAAFVVATAGAAWWAMENPIPETNSYDWHNNENSEGDEQCPTGSKPISETPWSGDHQQIKNGIGAGAADSTRIDPENNVWGQLPNGRWLNHGHAGSFTGSGKPSGRKGKDRKNRW